MKKIIYIGYLWLILFYHPKAYSMKINFEKKLSVCLIDGKILSVNILSNSEKEQILTQHHGVFKEQAMNHKGQFLDIYELDNGHVLGELLSEEGVNAYMESYEDLTTLLYYGMFAGESVENFTISTIFRDRKVIEDVVKLKWSNPIAELTNKRYSSYRIYGDYFLITDPEYSFGWIYSTYEEIVQSYNIFLGDASESCDSNVFNRVETKKLLVAPDEICNVTIIPYTQVGNLKQEKKAKEQEVFSKAFRHEVVYVLSDRSVLLVSGASSNSEGNLFSEMDFLKYLEFVKEAEEVDSDATVYDVPVAYRGIDNSQKLSSLVKNELAKNLGIKKRELDGSLESVLVLDEVVSTYLNSHYFLQKNYFLICYYCSEIIAKHLDEPAFVRIEQLPETNEIGFPYTNRWVVRIVFQDEDQETSLSLINEYFGVKYFDKGVLYEGVESKIKVWNMLMSGDNLFDVDDF